MDRSSLDSARPSYSQDRSFEYHKSASELPSRRTSMTTAALKSPSQQRHQRFVLSDPVAFSYLEEDRHTTVLDRSRDLTGYQLYVVEQWATSRTHPTFVIIAYTGDATHVIKAGVLSVPADEESWSPRMRVYFKSLAQYHARRKDTPLGVLMVTNLSTFPSSLTIVHIPDGDLRKHREDFFVAENLKRLGCSGRVGLSIGEPSSATQAKFYQLYRISDKINLYSAVVELVKLCQVSLILFGCLGPEYADGLLCDITENAINDWWAEIGSDLYNAEPTDGVLGPTSVAAILGTLIGARNRLNTFGAPVTKDVFDIEATKKATAYFQKSQNLRKTRRLDRVTLQKLHNATAKQASGDGWAVPRAVKSTVAELSGRGGEMVLDIVGRADKASIADIETVDIERFAQLVKGERAQWLWHGKARKRTTRDMFYEITEDQLRPLAGYSEEQAERDLPSKLSRAETNGERKRIPANMGQFEPASSLVEGTGPEEPVLKQGAFKRAKGRLKGVVVKRAPQPQGDVKAPIQVAQHSNQHSIETLDIFDDPPGYSSARMSLDPNERGNRYYKDAEHRGEYDTSGTTTPLDSNTHPTNKLSASKLQKHLDLSSNEVSRTNTHLSTIPSSVDPLSISKSRGNEGEEDREPADASSNVLRRTQSLYVPKRPRHDSWWPRALSFNAAIDAIFPDTDESLLSPSRPTSPSAIKDPAAALACERHHTRLAQAAATRIARLSTGAAQDVAAAIERVESLDVLAGQDTEQLNHLYYPRKDEFAALQEDSRGVLVGGKERLGGALRDAEALGQRLQYELGALRGKVEDVEGAVAEFERQVAYAEGRVRDLVGTGNTGTWSSSTGWSAWLRRKLLH